jgi:ketosteroid isomerase-like protein
VSAEAVHVVEEIQEALLADDVVIALDDTADQRVPRLFMQHAEPEFETVMVGPEYAKARLEYTGLAGFVEAWREWTTAFATFRIKIDDMIDAGDNVVSLVRQIATIEEGGPEIETSAAAVWMMREGLLHRVEFHLDRDLALQAAGVEAAP